jgi:hypothetical protein
MNTTTIGPISRVGFTTTTRGRWISVAGATYVAAWVVGLFVAPGAPVATASAGEVQGYYADNGPAILFQSSLIHGVAGLALAAIAIMVPSATDASPGLRRAVRVFGVGAALVSLLQVVFAVFAVSTASTAAATSTAALFHDLNLADTVKLTLLAVFAATATIAAVRAGMLSRWVRFTTVALVIALPLGGLAFVLDLAILNATLMISLPLLLLWAGALTWQVGRRAY